MWHPNRPILTNWNAGEIIPRDILFEVDGPTIFTAVIGITIFLFFKRDELHDAEIFIAAPVSQHEIELLKNGRVSVRGVLSYREAWLIQTDLDYQVTKFQEHVYETIEALLPPKGLAIAAKFGTVPDSVEQAEAYLGFKFVSKSMTSRSMPLSVFKGLVDDVSNLVKSALLPHSLAKGRNNRFFDVEIREPKFASLLITISEPRFDQVGLREHEPTRHLQSASLSKEATLLGEELWSSLETTARLAEAGEIAQEIAQAHRNALKQIKTIVPSEQNDLERLELTFHRAQATQVLSIDRKIGDRLLRAERGVDGDRRSIEGTIVEINGEAHTFIIKNLAQRQTTCGLPYEIFAQMERDGLMRRGQRLRITGTFWKRTRRDYIWFDRLPEPL